MRQRSATGRAARAGFRPVSTRAADATDATDRAATVCAAPARTRIGSIAAGTRIGSVAARAADPTDAAAPRERAVTAGARIRSESTATADGAATTLVAVAARASDCTAAPDSSPGIAAAPARSSVAATADAPDADTCSATETRFGPSTVAAADRADRPGFAAVAARLTSRRDSGARRSRIIEHDFVRAGARTDREGSQSQPASVGIHVERPPLT